MCAHRRALTGSSEGLHSLMSSLDVNKLLFLPQILSRLFLTIVFIFLFRGFAVTLLFGKTNSEKHLEKCEHSYLPPTPTGIAKVDQCFSQ